MHCAGQGCVLLANVTLVVCFACCPGAACADAIVSEWALGVSVDATPGPSDSQTFITVQNPFTGAHSASIPGGQAAAQYDISWLMDYAAFSISAQQTAQASATSNMYTGNAGRIRLTVTEPMPLHIDASWTYSLPVDFMQASMLVTVYGAQSHVTMFGYTNTDGTFPGEPASGTFTAEGDVILTPGETWILRYDLNLHPYSGTQGYSATGFGVVDFQITPEPATLALLAPLLLAFHRPAARRRRTRSP
jgi:hypothetical protein